MKHETNAHVDYDSWTDQLVQLHRLYSAAIECVRLARESHLSNDAALNTKSTLRAQRLILEIIAGLNPSFGEVPQQVNSLCQFCLHCLEDPNSENLRAVEEVLTILAEGFREITEEVRQLDNTGQLPQREVAPGLIDTIA